MLSTKSDNSQSTIILAEDETCEFDVTSAVVFLKRKFAPPKLSGARAQKLLHRSRDTRLLVLINDGGESRNVRQRHSSSEPCASKKMICLLVCVNHSPGIPGADIAEEKSADSRAIPSVCYLIMFRTIVCVISCVIIPCMCVAAWPRVNCKLTIVTTELCLS